MKEMTEQEAFATLAAQCAQREHCQWEMVEKMRRWQLSDAVQARVMERLVGGQYVDDARYARAFVKDKVRYNKWGRRKVEQALRQKRIDEDICRQALDEVDDSEYLSVLRPLLKNRSRSVTGSTAYERNQKLIRFAYSRGFTFDIIKQCIQVDDEDQYEDDDEDQYEDDGEGFDDRDD